jgi:hypothetical protein
MCVYQFFPVMSKPMSVISRGTKKKKKKLKKIRNGSNKNTILDVIA